MGGGSSARTGRPYCKGGSENTTERWRAYTQPCSLDEKRQREPRPSVLRRVEHLQDDDSCEKSELGQDTFATLSTASTTPPWAVGQNARASGGLSRCHVWVERKGTAILGKVAAFPAQIAGLLVRDQKLYASCWARTTGIVK